MDRATKALVAGLLLSFGLWGCGYSLQGRATPLPQEIRTITIPTMTNQTLEAGIENAFTRAVIREFNLDGRLKVVRENRADSLLEGSIQDFSLYSTAYDASGLALEYRAQVIMGVTFRRIDTGEILLEAPSLTQVDEYRVTSDIPTDEGRKRAAIDEIARQLAETIHDLILERF